MGISLEEYEKLDPKCTMEIEGKKLIFQTPNLLTKWRADTLLTKEPHTIEWLNEIDKEEVLLDIGANVDVFCLCSCS